MRRRSCLIVLLLGLTSPAQEPPAFTPQRRKAYIDLTDAAVSAGAVRFDGHGADARVDIDAARMRTFAAGRKKEWTPELRDALVAAVGNLGTNWKPVPVALLDAFGRETGDERALGFARFFTARAQAADPRRWRDAEQSYRQAAAHFADTGETAWQAASLNNLGALLDALGEFDRARPCFEESLDLCRKLYPPGRFPHGHTVLARSLSNLGALLQSQGEYGQAQPYHEQSLAMSRRLYPPDRFPNGHADLAAGLTNLSEFLRDCGEQHKARPCAEQALALHRRLYPPARFPDGHQRLADSLTNLGGLLQTAGEVGPAQALYQEALAMRQKLYPPTRFPDGHP